MDPSPRPRDAFDYSYLSDPFDLSAGPLDSDSDSFLRRLRGSHLSRRQDTVDPDTLEDRCVRAFLMSVAGCVEELMLYPADRNEGQSVWCSARVTSESFTDVCTHRI